MDRLSAYLQERCVGILGIVNQIGINNKIVRHNFIQVLPLALDPQRIFPS